MSQSFNLKNGPFKRLIEAFMSFDDLEDCQRFLLDLCTPAELQSLTDRLEVARLITQGNSYRAIAEKTKTSTATITRVGRTLKYGQGGYAHKLTKTLGIKK